MGGRCQVGSVEHLYSYIYSTQDCCMVPCRLPHSPSLSCVEAQVSASDGYTIKRFASTHSRKRSPGDSSGSQQKASSQQAKTASATATGCSPDKVLRLQKSGDSRSRFPCGRGVRTQVHLYPRTPSTCPDHDILIIICKLN